MNKILTIDHAAKLSKKLKKENKTIVLAGGCFDILHYGHIVFLKEAKKRGNTLFVLLESDESVKKRKGEKRPINSQISRAGTLSKLGLVDYIVMLSGVTKDEEYDRIMFQIKPAVVAQTAGDPNSAQRKKQCEMVGAKLISVTKSVKGASTTKILER